MREFYPFDREPLTDGEDYPPVEAPASFDTYVSMPPPDPTTPAYAYPPPVAPAPPKREREGKAPTKGLIRRAGSAQVGEWKPVRVRKTGRVLQAVTIGALSIFAFLGAYKTFLAPSPQTAPIEAPTQSVDITAVGDVAVSWARSYLSLDQAQTRTGRLEANWSSPDKAGWDGKGSIKVAGNPYVVSSRPLGQDIFEVTVAAYIQTANGGGNWVGVLVPIQLDVQGRASASGEMKITGLPAPAPLPTQTARPTDNTLSADTRSEVETFFSAWAKGESDALAAPGANIPKPKIPGSSIRLEEWKVFEGEGNTRAGEAKATWIVSGAQLTCTYHITITQVQAGTASRWQVQSLN